MNLLEWYQLFELLVNVLGVIGGSALTAAHVNPKYFKHIPMAKKVINWIGQNVHHAKNK